MRALSCSLVALLLTIGNTAFAQNLSQFVDKVQSYQRGVKLEVDSSFLKDDYSFVSYKIDTTTFNVDTYKGFFDQLTFKKNHTLYAVHLNEGVNGICMLFMMPDSVHVDKYLDKIVEKENLKEDINRIYRKRAHLYTLATDSISKAYNNVVPNESVEGFFQYLYLYAMGESFGTRWDAVRSMRQVIAGKESFKYYDQTFFRSPDLRNCVDWEEHNKLLDVDMILPKNWTAS